MRAYAVLGPWRGGTSLVTGILRALGVYVGDEFLEANTGYCTFEDVGLREVCLNAFDERPGCWRYGGTPESRVDQLRFWIRTARERADALGCVACGGKHAVMCKLVDELEQAWTVPGETEFTAISVMRSVEGVHRSWTRPVRKDGGHWWPRPDRLDVVDDLIRSRDRSLASRPHIGVDFDRLRTDPEATISQLARECGLPVAKIPTAVAMVQHQRR